MNYLLDTHTFVWLDVRSANLSPRAKSVLSDPDHTLFVSMASIWEMQIKAQLGKLTLRVPLSQLIAEQQQADNIHLLSVSLEHIFELGNLANHHRDPFDRLLIAQARIEDMPIISGDPRVAEYGVEVIW